jgi:hypothetical protein
LQSVYGINADFRSHLLSHLYFQSLAHLFEPFRFKTNEDRTLQEPEIELLNTIISLVNSIKVFFPQQSEVN